MEVKEHLMCDCKSYNLGIGTVPEVSLDPRPYFQSDLPGSVCIDACIVEQIKMLWQHGIWTLNSCCGHSKSPYHGMEVIIESSADAYEAKRLLRKHDPNRNWSVRQWKLVTI